MKVVNETANKLLSKKQKSNLQDIWKGKIDHIIYPCKLKGNVRPDQIITNKETWCKTLFLSLQINKTSNIQKQN